MIVHLPAIVYPAGKTGGQNVAYQSRAPRICSPSAVKRACA